MNELFREIEDDIRRERFDRFWHHFGKLMIGASVAVVLATVAIVVIQNHKQAAAMDSTDQFVHALARLDAQNYKDAVTAFTTLTEDSASPYYGMAMLRKAQAQDAGGDKEGAAKTYEALALRDSAFGEIAALHNENSIIVPDKKMPFYHTLAEAKAWELLKTGKKDEAVTQFLALRDDAEAPYSMRSRMQEVLQQIAPQKVAQPKVVVHE